MFKQAYVRGVQNTLIQAGHAAFPDEQSAAIVFGHRSDASGLAGNRKELGRTRPPSPEASVGAHP